MGWNFGDGSSDLVKGTYTNGSPFAIKAGNGLAVAAGVSYSLNANTDLQFSVGHERTTTASPDGEFAFTRVPVDSGWFWGERRQLLWIKGAGRPMLCVFVLLPVADAGVPARL